MADSYQMKGVAPNANAQVYGTYLSALGLDGEHKANLRERGLSNKEIKANGYATKPVGNSAQAIKALGTVETAYDLEGVPGFFLNEKRNIRSVVPIRGMCVPCRDPSGGIHGVVVRTEGLDSKYVAFSSAGKPQGARSWQNIHVPLGERSTKLRITEGILKADVATALGDVLCLGMHGLHPSKDTQHIFETLEVSTLVIALDQEESRDVKLATGKLIQQAVAFGCDWEIELWDPSDGKGIDDVLKSGGEIRYAKPEEKDAIEAEANAANPWSVDWVYVVSIERFYNKTTGQQLKKSQFADKFGMGSTDAVNKLLEMPYPRVDGMTYWPEAEEEVIDGNIRCVNIWKPCKVMPVSGEMATFLDHVSYLVPDEEEAGVVLDWMAYQVQYPGKKVHWSLLVQGIPGTGKSFLGEAMRTVLGASNVRSPSNEEIHEPYTGWCKEAQLVVIEEVMAKGRLELMNKLKPLITQPIANIREMYTPPYEQPNRFNLMMFTNHPDSIIIDKDDRRYCVIASPAEPKGTAYYNMLFKWLHENAGAVLYYFQNRDISEFQPMGHAPMTEGKKDLIETSRSILEEWIENGIEEEAWPFQGDLVNIRHIKQSRLVPPAVAKVSDVKWSHAMKSAMCVPYKKQVRLSDGSNARIWIVRRYQMYNSAEPSFIKSEYERTGSDNYSESTIVDDQKDF